MAGKQNGVDPQTRTVELLEELVRWTKVTSLPHVRQLLLDLLPGDENKMAYQYSDGRKSEELSDLVGVDSSTIRDWGKIWIRAGIAEPMRVQRGERAKRVFSLEDFGIDVPAPKAGKIKKQEVVQPPASDDRTSEKKNE